MKKKSKRYLELKNCVDKNKAYSKEEAISLVKKTSKAGFDTSVEVAIRLNVDTKKADQQLRGAIVLPNGTGKTKKVLVLTKTYQQEALKAGAEYVGDIDMIEKIEKQNWFDFDVIIASPDRMPSLGKIGKLLGPKGLMPNPKTGTVTNDVKKAIEDVKKGRVEYRTDSFGNVHTLIGKASFNEQQLIENLNEIVNVVLRAKPSTVKGNYVKNISISTTMGPGVKISLDSFDK